ncbi:uncharacterized protein LOC144100550 [Amblyomma americanum]
MSCSSEWSQRHRLRFAQARPPTPPSPPPLPSSPATDAGTSNGNGARTVAPTEGSPTSSPSLTAALVRARNGVGNTKSQNEELKIRERRGQRDRARGPGDIAAFRRTCNKPA